MTMDIKLYYEKAGKGFPIIFLHGNGESGDYFKHQVSYFSDRYCVITVDTRGHGKSPRGTAEFSIAQFADDLNDFMNRWRIQEAVILGFSDGANIAMRFALKYPKKVRALILNGGNLNPKGVKPTVQIPIEIGYRIASLFAGRSKEAKSHAEMLGLMVNDPDIEAEELGKIKTPCLVIAGSKDMIKAKHTKLIAASVPRAELKIVRGTHFVANEEPQIFNEAVDAFLRKHKI